MVAFVTIQSNLLVDLAALLLALRFERSSTAFAVLHLLGAHGATLRFRLPPLATGVQGSMRGQFICPELAEPERLARSFPFQQEVPSWLRASIA